MWSGQPCRARAANDDFLEQSWFEMEVFTGSERRDSLMEPEISAGTDSSVGIYPSTILLVDDDPDIRSLTRTFLAHEGYSVLSSGDAERAVQIFRAVPQIDLLVTDLYMPGQSGMELARELKAMRPELPVLMISGGFLEGEQEEKLQAVGWSFLAKPFRLPELLSTVHRILAPVEARRWRDANQGVPPQRLLDGTLSENGESQGLARNR
jgi:two-component system chemotaxis response regulator CheY